MVHPKLWVPITKEKPEVMKSNNQKLEKILRGIGMKVPFKRVALVIVIIAVLLKSIVLAFAGDVPSTIKAEGSNIVLYIPASSPFDSFCVQYRTTLDATSKWTTLNHCVNSDNSGTNIFTHEGILSPQSSMESIGGAEDVSAPPAISLELLAVRKDGAGSAVPVSIYPPGFLFDNFIIIDPSSGEQMDGAGFARESVSPVSPMNVGIQASSGPLLPPVGGTVSGDGGASSFVSTAGFYRVLHVPDFNFDVTYRPFYDPTFFSINFGEDYDNVRGVDVLLNGEPTDCSVLMDYDSGGTTYHGVGIYFDQLTNGNYTIQLQTTLAANDIVGDGSQFLVLSNNPVNITVSNTVYFPDWDYNIVGDSYTFKAQSTVLDTDFYIDILDAWGNWLMEGSGHTTDGRIEWTWDLYDWYGGLHDSLDNDPYFDTYTTIMVPDTAPAGGMALKASSASTKANPGLMIQFPNVGSWLFAYQDRFYLESGNNASFNQTYLNAISTMCGAPALRNYPFSTLALAFGTNHTQAERDNSYDTLKAYLYSSGTRSFFYYGHGNPNAIGCDTNHYDTNGVEDGGRTTPNSKAYVTSKWIKENVTCNKYSGYHDWNFVYLHGCDTADGDLPEAFGFDKAKHDLNWYKDKTNNPNKFRPGIFVGFSGTIGNTNWGGENQRWLFNKYIYGNWSVDLSTHFSKAVLDAVNATSWFPKGMNYEIWFKMYGYTEMKFNEYNTKGSWPP